MDTGFTFADIYDEVVSRAGGEQSTVDDVMRVRRGLVLLLNEWEAAGYNTWRIKSLRLTTPLASDTITLPRHVDDVVMITREAGGELERVPMDVFMQRYKVSATGATPASWALFREEDPVLRFYPYGAEIKLVVWYVQRPDDFDRAQSNLDDIPSRWLNAVIAGLAHDLACKRPPYNEALISRLERESIRQFNIAKDNDRDRARFRYRIR